MLVLASTEITAFHVIGAILAIWAVILSALGIMRHSFPPKGAEMIVIAISAVLVVGTVGAAVTTAEEKPKSEEQEGFRNKSGKEGSSAPDSGGTQAPETGQESGQTPAGETGQKPPAPATGQTLTINADPGGDLRFDKGTLKAKPGEIRIVMNNPSSLPHNVTLEGPGGLDEDGKTVPKGGASQVSAKLQPGKYTYYCDVAGHREAGMEGILTVAK